MVLSFNERRDAVCHVERSETSPSILRIIEYRFFATLRMTWHLYSFFRSLKTCER
jgi:hypothetical protein